MKKILFFLPLLCAIKLNAQLCFTQTYSNAAGATPYGICHADFDGDGFADLAMADGTGMMKVYHSTGTGNFSVMTNIAAGNTPEGIIAADLNGDGKTDLACANFNSANISVSFGNGLGVFAAVVNYNTGGGPKDLTATDLDGDGDLDLAVINSNANSISTLLNNGTGTFTLWANIASGGGAPYGVCSADFNKDGKMDVFVVNNTGNNAVILLGNGDGTLQTATTIPGVALTSPFSACTADLNKDGNADVSVADMNSNSVVVYYGNGNGTFGSINLPLPGGATNPRFTCIADFNGDGDLDIATANYQSNTISFLLGPNLTGGQFINVGSSTGVRWITSGDYNADGKPDLATTANTNGMMTAFLNGFPFITFSGATSICTGSSTTITAAGASTYTWSANAGSVTTASATVSPATTDTYSVSGNLIGCGITNTKTVTITVNPLPTVTANASSTLACVGSPEILTGSGSATSYTWTGGVTDGVVFPAALQTYTVTGIDANNCVNTATISINAPSPGAPNICMVTVDSLSFNNLIIWDKTLYPSADTFYVYRDTANNNYVIVGRIAYAALSQYIDTARHTGAVNGDPNITTYRYKLAFKDTCGNVSPLSPYHNTIYNYHINSLFLWNAYQIEGQSTPVSGLSNYVLKRDNLGGTGNYVTAATAGASAGSINDPQYATYQLTADWRVETVWNITCIPTARQSNGVAGAVVKSKSNISNNRTTGINKILNQLVSVYPNPNNGNMFVHFNSNLIGKITLKVYSVMGNEVYNKTLVNPSTEVTVDLTNFENGIYLVQLISDAGTITKRILKN